MTPHFKRQGEQSLRRLVTLIFSILCASCASTTQHQAHPDLTSYGSDFAIVHFVRSNSFYGAAIAAPVEVDDYLIGSIGPGDSLTIKVPAKEVSVSTTKSRIVLDAEKGFEYFFKIHLPFHGIIAFDEFEISAIDKKQARELGLN